jgi:outer membrane protein assembly complex protein YaeT
MAANELKDHGYPYAQVTVEEQSAGPHETNLTFVAQPGTLAHFGSVEIQGEKSVDENIIRRALLYKPGELFRRSQVQETQRKLYGMELFQFANVEVLNPEEQSPEVKTRVTVAEGKHRQVNFGVGYGTEEKARADAQFHYLNFLGGARTAGAHVRYSSLDRGVRLDFNQPYLFAPHFSLGAEAQQWYTYEPAYNLLTRGAHVTLTHRANQQTSWSATLLHEFDRNSVSDVALKDPTLRSNLIALGLDPVTGKQEGTVSSVAFDYQRNTTANLLNATNGYVLSGHVEQAGRFLPGTFKYFALSSEGRHYFTLAKRFVIANKVQIASIDATGDRLTNVPFSKRYFLGGATSVRGWGRFEISPLIQGLPIGGFSLLTASSELRMPLYGNFGGVLFVDAGNVWSTAWEYHLNDLRYAVGPGLRYMTPIGPIRFDVGFQVNPIQGLIINGDPEKRHWRIHFSIGQAF